MHYEHTGPWPSQCWATPSVLPRDWKRESGSSPLRRRKSTQRHMAFGLFYSLELVLFILHSASICSFLRIWVKSIISFNSTSYCFSLINRDRLASKQTNNEKTHHLPELNLWTLTWGYLIKKIFVILWIQTLLYPMGFVWAQNGENFSLQRLKKYFSNYVRLLLKTFLIPGLEWADLFLKHVEIPFFPCK